MEKSNPSESNAQELINELQLLYDDAPCGYHSLDVQGKVIRVNNTELKMLGYSREEMLGQKYTKFLTTESIKIFKTHFPQVKRGERFYDVEMEIVCKDGSIVPVSTTVTAIADNKGKFVMTRSILINISERKKLEKERQEAEAAKQELELALSSSEAKLKRILDNAIATIASYWAFPDRSWTFNYWSVGCEKLLGYTAEELINDQNLFSSRIPREDLEQVIFAEFENLYTQQTGNMEYRFRHKDNSLRWLSVTYLIHWVEAKNYWVGTNIFTDITQRKEAEIALQEQLHREKLITTISHKIRQTLDLDQILQTTVDQVQKSLQSDRVIIFRFEPDFKSGTIITESVANGYPSILLTKVDDLSVIEQYLKLYHQEKFIIRANVYESETDPRYFELAQQFQMKANVGVPIFQGEQLWGLLAVHQCSAPRQWQDTEIELLKQLAIQVGIAIQQSQLYQQTRQELLERQKAQKALASTEQQLQAILEYAPVVIYLLDLENKYLLVNRHYGELLATTPEHFLGKSIYDIWPKELADVFARNNRQVVENNQVLETEEIGLLADGLHTYISLKFPLYDAAGKIYAVCGISTDITERQAAERKIAEQAALIDITTDAMIVRDLDQRILFWNQGAENLYGWTADEVIGKKIYDFLYKNNDNTLNLAIATVIKKGFWQGELEQVTKNRQQIIVSSRWTLVENDLKQPQSILSVNTDITEKKQLEKQFYQTQRLESLGTLASGIAHDLNNVFTPILGIVQLLPLKVKNLDERTNNFLKMLEDTVRRGIDLVQQILSFARGTDSEKNELDLKILIKEIAKMAQEILPRSIIFSTNIPEHSSLLLKADCTQLHQILMNLVINARDAMPDGGKMTISAQNQFIDLIYASMNLKSILGNYQEGNYIVITVSDTGSGISPEVLEHIFEPFFTTKEVGKGTGLGLSTVLGIVKNHGGFLQVFSTLGQGTEFKIYLPAIAEKSTQEETTEKKLLDGHGQLILIVDDEPFIREITQFSLNEHNYQTMVANDGIEAIALYTKYAKEISVVLMDIVMPSINGLNAIQTLKKIDPNIRIIANSGLAEHRQAAICAGSQVFLMKPYTIYELLEILTAMDI
jgi:PAS domain S-box-containing protein